MVHECPICNGRWQTNVRNPQQCPCCEGSLTSTRVVPDPEPPPVHTVGQVIDNSHGGSPFTGDWLFPIAVVCWPITVPLGLLAALWFFGIAPLWEKLRAPKRIVQAPPVHTVSDGRGRIMIVDPNEQRATRYEAEGNTAMAEHTRRMYGLPSKIAASSFDSPRT